MAMGASLPAMAQSLPIIRDTETENLLRDYAIPIFRAAGVNSRSVDIIIVNRMDFNAFVVSGRLMFINAGVLLDAKTPNEVIGIIAHETGHIAGGHNIRLRQQMERAQIMATLAAIVGGAAAIGGAAAGNRSASDAGRAIASAGGHVALRQLLAYRRSEEDAADQSALKYLEATKQSAKGMISTFENFASQEMFTRAGTDPYGATHPESRARIASIITKAEASPYFNTPDSPSLLRRHKMMQAKLAGYMEHPRSLSRRFADKNSPEARYAQAMAALRSSETGSTLRLLDGLIREEPQNPYYWEIRGEALLKARRAQEAEESYAKAISLAPNADLIRVSLAEAQLARGNVKGAIANFEKGLANDRTNPTGFLQLARAYAQDGKEGHASLATARARLLQGNLPEARNFAKRAQSTLPRGSAAWLQAEDILQIKG